MADVTGRGGGSGAIARRQPDARAGSIPRPGETWRPVGRKALVASAFLAPIERVRMLVPEELEIVPVLPGRTLATVFLADYGPGSTLEYHEFGMQPALVRFRGEVAAWNSLLLVDSPASVRGGRMLGFNKHLAEFDWWECVGSRGEVFGACIIRAEGREVVRIGYRQGRIPLPSVPVRAMAIRDDLVLRCSNRLRGRYRLSPVIFDPEAAGAAGPLDLLGRPLLGVVATGYRGAMVDDLRAIGFLPGRGISPLGDA